MKEREVELTLHGLRIETTVYPGSSSSSYDEPDDPAEIDEVADVEIVDKEEFMSWLDEQTELKDEMLNQALLHLKGVSW
jgi:hypothetical protein